jgi:quercetin dioxygenase-like cupin family protein
MSVPISSQPGISAVNAIVIKMRELNMSAFSRAAKPASRVGKSVTRVVWNSFNRSRAIMTARTVLVVPVVATLLVATTAVAQQAKPDAFRRTTLQTVDFPPGYETVSVIAELPSGRCTGRHTHPGAESAYVLEGEAVAKFDGKPDLILKAGQPLQFGPGVVHNVCNSSGVPFKALAHYIVEKGKPLSTPAP